MKKKKLTLTTFEKNTVLLFIIPIYLSIIGVAYVLLTQNDSNYLKYVMGNIPGRIFLVILNITILTGLLTMCIKWSEKEVNNLIKYYYYGLLIFAIFGVWQFFHFLIGIPYINIETRDFIHSVHGTGFFINNRLTSFANEPSFLAPLVIDLLIISFIVSKRPKIIMLISLFVLIFSYSGGGYLNLLIILPVFVLGYMKYKGYKFKRKHLGTIFLILIFLTIAVFNYYEQLLKLTSPVFGRLDSFFDINNHARMYMIVMSFIWSFDGGIVTALFGHGPSSYNYLELTQYLPNGTPVHPTSNNLFADTVYELGYVGFICYVVIFYRFIRESLKNIYDNQYFLISFILSVHLSVSSIYRADYMQPRFWIIVFIILMMLRIGRKRLQITK
ncbi:O-antigen polymerase [Robertmurraya massiliosenegalensis]|uniref:O-antigen ligase family protein n=1 Tax=Robertmurraya massiliosenegalensis TaxID=1287657 RepID=UPI003D2B2FEA